MLGGSPDRGEVPCVHLAGLEAYVQLYGMVKTSFGTGTKSTGSISHSQVTCTLASVLPSLIGTKFSTRVYTS